MPDLPPPIGFGGGALLHFDSVTSTMDVAREQPISDLPTTVVASSQTAGRGRFDRQWISPPSGGLYLTVRIPWTRPVREAPLVSIGAALALARLATQLGCTDIVLKWPNDLLLGGRKVAGILAEMCHSDLVSHLLVGVGINLSIPMESLLKVGQPAVSLSEACGKEFDPSQILSRFLSIWSEIDKTLERKGFAPLAREFRSRSDLFGRQFILSSGVEREVVEVRDIRDDGALEVQRLSSGEIDFAFAGELLSLGST